MALAAVHGVRMRSGVLDRRVTFMRPAVIEDPVYGPQDNGWEEAPNASRLPAQKWDNLPSQSESVQGGLRMADRPARLRLRFRSDLTSDMRVVMHDENDRIYEISGGPAEIGRREWVEFTIRAYTS